MKYRIPDIERFAVVLEIVEVKRIVVSLVTAVGHLAQSFNPALHQRGPVDVEALDDDTHFRIVKLLLDHVQATASSFPVLDLIAGTVLVAVASQHLRFGIFLHYNSTLIIGTSTQLVMFVVMSSSSRTC